MVESAELTLPDAEVLNTILKALSKVDGPISVNKLWDQIPKSCRPSKARFAELLERSVMEGSLWQYAPRQKNAACFLDRPTEQYAREVILSEVSKAPLTVKQLAGKISSRLRDLTLDRRSAILAELVDQGTVIELPKKSGSKAHSYSTKPPDPHDYLVAAVGNLQRAVKKIALLLSQSGVSCDKTYRAALELVDERFGSDSAGRETANGNSTDNACSAPAGGPNSTVTADPSRIESALPVEQLDDRIIELLTELSDSTSSPLVAIGELRRSFDLYSPDKSTFDRAVLNLSRQGKIALHRHDYPQQLNPVDREMLVFDGQNYFSGVSLRQ